MAECRYTPIGVKDYQYGYYKDFFKSTLRVLLRVL